MDLRLPIGYVFTIYGIILSIYGLVTKSNVEMYKRSEDININIIWGLVMLAFGALMLFFAKRGSKGA